MTAIVVVVEHDGSLLLDLARRHVLTVYDTAYPEVAIRRSLPLATPDRRVHEAASALGITTIPDYGVPEA